MRTLCATRQLVCTRPPRGLIRLARQGVTTLGWGLFTQALDTTPSYYRLLNFGRGTNAHFANWSTLNAASFDRCRTVPGDAGAPSPAARENNHTPWTSFRS